MRDLRRGSGCVEARWVRYRPSYSPRAYKGNRDLREKLSAGLMVSVCLQMSDRRQHRLASKVASGIGQEIVDRSRDRLRRAAAHMRRQDDVAQRQQGFRRMRLALIDVETRAGDRAGGKCIS